MNHAPNPLAISRLFDETTFYPQFIADLQQSQREVIIESPYITTERVNIFIPIFQTLLEKGIQIYIMTRDPNEHEFRMEIQAEQAIRAFEIIGVQPLLCLGNHHRKLAILDRKILWEGSLNILSQTYSRELMRRIESIPVTQDTFKYLKYDRIVG